MDSTVGTVLLTIVFYTFSLAFPNPSFVDERFFLYPCDLSAALTSLFVVDSFFLIQQHGFPPEALPSSSSSTIQPGYFRSMTKFLVLQRSTPTLRALLLQFLFFPGPIGLLCISTTLAGDGFFSRTTLEFLPLIPVFEHSALSASPDASSSFFSLIPFLREIILFVCHSNFILGDFIFLFSFTSLFDATIPPPPPPCRCLMLLDGLQPCVLPPQVIPDPFALLRVLGVKHTG